MNTVISNDGTTIAYDQVGQGPAVILVTGALGFRSHEMQAGLVAPLEQHFTVINYDRRGRGDSGDTLPYAPEREYEDIEALIDAVGGSAYVYGLSSGAILALKAMRAFPHKVKKLALYEPPFILDDSRPPLPADYVEKINAAVAAGNRDKAVEIFMTEALLIPAEFVAMMRAPQPAEAGAAGEPGGAAPPSWTQMESLAHTLAYDGEIVRELMTGNPWPPDTWASATSPTLVITGENSEPFFHDGAKALVRDLPNARHYVLAGQDHAVAPSALAPVLVEFFKS